MNNVNNHVVDDMRPPDENRGIKEPLLPQEAPEENENPEDAEIPLNQMFFPWFDRYEIRDRNYYNA